MDTIAKEQRHKTMQAIKSAGTKIETKLAKALWAKGYRYRKNCKNILGKPDIVFRKYKLAIFCDSEFWHGKKFIKNPNYIHSNKKYWTEKIKRNMERDKLVNKQLKKEGWIVIRFWGKEIEKNIENCIKHIRQFIK